MKSPTRIERMWNEERAAYEAMKASEACFRALPPGDDERETRSLEYERAFYAWNAIVTALTASDEAS